MDTDVDEPLSLAKRSFAPTPDFITETFIRTVPRFQDHIEMKNNKQQRVSEVASFDLKAAEGVAKSKRDHYVASNDSLIDKELFVNAQWAVGGEGTGAPIHFHNTAW